LRDIFEQGGLWASEASKKKDTVKTKYYSVLS